MASTRLLLTGIAAALVWYYLSFHVLWKAISPLVPLLHTVRPTIVGHIIYGAVIGRYPRYLPRRPSGNAPPDVENLPVSTQVSDQ